MSETSTILHNATGRSSSRVARRDRMRHTSTADGGHLPRQVSEHLHTPPAAPQPATHYHER
ncbi:MAG: hypothetical protein IPG75_22710 [Gemmatimonadetes bacterium]|nr:hypothetical protein [Gemmatimonadota bacterium]